MASGTAERLYELILERKRNPRRGSYTCRLFDSGREGILRKFGEEALEVILASGGDGKDRLVHELADLFYHTLVLMVQEGVTPEEVIDELESRFDGGGTAGREKPLGEPGRQRDL